jgi:hypothetical protein
MTLSRAFKAIGIGRNDKNFALEWVDDLSKVFRGEPILVIRGEASRLLLASSTQCAQKIAITIVSHDYLLTSADDYSLIVFAGTPDQAFISRNSYFLRTPRLRVYSVTSKGVSLIPGGQLFQ